MIWFILLFLLVNTATVLFFMGRAPVIEFDDEHEKELLQSLRETKQRRNNSLHYVPLPDLQTPQDAVRV